MDQRIIAALANTRLFVSDRAGAPAPDGGGCGHCRMCGKLAA
jgi:hypothetical protein